MINIRDVHCSEIGVSTHIPGNTDTMYILKDPRNKRMGETSRRKRRMDISAEEGQGPERAVAPYMDGYPLNSERKKHYHTCAYVTLTFRSPLTILLFTIWSILYWTSFSAPPIQPNRLQEIIKAGLKRTRILSHKGGHDNGRVIKFHTFRIHAATLRCSSGMLRSVSWQLATSHRHECLTYTAVTA